MNSKFLGPVLIGIGAVLWATDAVFRVPMVARLDPTLIVFYEHLIAVTAMLPWIWFNRKAALALRAQEWIAAALIGIGGSAFGTIFFTASFKYINPSVAILLQKFQPIICALLAFAILGERPGKSFVFWATAAIGAGVVLAFPDLKFGFLAFDFHSGLDLRSRGILYTLAAAGLWAVSTVGGKILLRRTSPPIATFWRFSFGLGTTIALLTLGDVRFSWDTLAQPELLRSLAYMSLIPGLLAMILYYGGLRRTQASIATFVELIFPASAILINTYYLKMPLLPVQIVSGVVLLAAVTRISVKPTN